MLGSVQRSLKCAPTNKSFHHFSPPVAVFPAKVHVTLVPLPVLQSLYLGGLGNCHGRGKPPNLVPLLVMYA